MGLGQSSKTPVTDDTDDGEWSNIQNPYFDFLFFLSVYFCGSNQKESVKQTRNYTSCEVLTLLIAFSAAVSL